MQNHTKRICHSSRTIISAIYRIYRHITTLKNSQQLKNVSFQFSRQNHVLLTFSLKSYEALITSPNFSHVFFTSKYLLCSHTPWSGQSFGATKAEWNLFFLEIHLVVYSRRFQEKFALWEEIRWFKFFSIFKKYAGPELHQIHCPTADVAVTTATCKRSPGCADNCLLRLWYQNTKIKSVTNFWWSISTAKCQGI